MTDGWKLSEDRKRITFTDGKQIGKLKLIGSRDLNFYQPDQTVIVYCLFPHRQGLLRCDRSLVEARR